MKRKKSEMADGSILLLDTMCNAFGGIIFISFLLVILINSTSESAVSTAATSTSRESLIEAESERDELTTKLARLKSAAETQAATTGAIVSKELLESAARIKTEEARRTVQIQKRSSIVGSNNRAQIEINQLEKAKENEFATLDSLRRKLAAITSKINEKIDTQSRTATTPKMSRAGKLVPFQYFLQNKELFGPAILPNGQRNTHEFTFTDVGGEVSVAPVATRGLRIADDGKNIAAIQQKLSIASPSWNSIHLHIWEDSFREFETVRLALEKSDLTYAIVPWEPGDKLKLTSDTQERWEQK